MNTVEGTSLVRSYVDWATPDFKADRWYKIVGKVLLIAATFFIYGPVALYDWATIAWPQKKVILAAQKEIEAKVSALQNRGLKPPENFLEEHYRASHLDKAREDAKSKRDGIVQKVEEDDAISKEQKAQEVERRIEQIAQTEAAAAVRKQFLADVPRRPFLVDGRRIIKEDLQEKEGCPPVFPIDQYDPKILALFHQAVFADGMFSFVHELMGNPDTQTSDKSKYQLVGRDHFYGFELSEEDELPLKLSTEKGGTVTGINTQFVCCTRTFLPLAVVRCTTTIHLQDPTQSSYLFESRPLASWEKWKEVGMKKSDQA